MRELRRLSWYNITAYFSFLLYLLLGLNGQTIQYRIYLIGLPVFLLLVTLFIIVSFKDSSFVHIKIYCIMDFAVRLISLELCVVGSVFSYNRLRLTIVLAILIVLLTINLTLEKSMSIRLNRYQENQEYASTGQGHALISLGVSYLETVLLLFLLLFPYNLRPSMKLSSTLMWGGLFVVLLVLYIRLTIHSLIKFYKNEKEARFFFIIENVGVFVLLACLSLYGYFFDFITITDVVFYFVSMLMLVPRQVSRIRRLVAYNQQIGGNHVKIAKSKT